MFQGSEVRSPEVRRKEVSRQKKSKFRGRIQKKSEAEKSAGRSPETKKDLNRFRSF
jgi:hypothetical protein